jgi:hypothetical protein
MISCMIIGPIAARWAVGPLRRRLVYFIANGRAVAAGTLCLSLAQQPLLQIHP